MAQTQVSKQMLKLIARWQQAPRSGWGGGGIETGIGIVFFYCIFDFSFCSRGNHTRVAICETVDGNRKEEILGTCHTFFRNSGVADII